MSRKLLLAMLLAGLLVAAPLAARADGDATDEEYDDEDESAGDGAAGASGDDEKDVVVIGDKNWTETVGKSKFALVEFYAPWCGHCQRLKPEWAKAATAVKEVDGGSVVVGKVDATVEPEMAKKLGVSGYPTIKWFVDGELVSDYAGPREADGIARWIKKKTGPAAATLADPAALAAAEADAAVLVVGFFKDLKGAEHDAFAKVAQKTEDAVFAQTTDAATAKAAGIAGGAPSFSVVSNHPNEERATAPGKKITADSVEALLKENKLPVVVPFNDDNSPKIFGSGIERQVLLVAKGGDLDPKGGSKIAKAFRGAAANYRGKLTFVTVDVESKSAAPVTGFFGVKPEDAPLIVGFEMSANKKYKYAGDLGAEKPIKKFADDLSANKLTPEYKSAPVPEPLLDDEGVAVIVGKNFDGVVKDAKKDVLLEVYAPWCGHCKQLAPIYAKLAKRFAKVDSVVIAKMDGTENEHPEVEVKGYPSLVFYPAEKGAKPITYDGGDRSLKAMTKFIKKHAKVAYELPKKDKAEGGGKEDGKEDKEEEEEEVKDEL